MDSEQASDPLSFQIAFASVFILFELASAVGATLVGAFLLGVSPAAWQVALIAPGMLVLGIVPLVIAEGMARAIPRVRAMRVAWRG